MKKMVLVFFLCCVVSSSHAVLAETGPSERCNYASIAVGGVSGDFLLGDDLESKIEFPDSPGRTSLPDADLSTGYVLSLRYGRLVYPPYRQRTTMELAAELEGLIIGGTDVNDEFSGLYFRFTDSVSDDVDPFLVTAPVSADCDISIKAMMLNVILRSPYGSVHPYGGIGIGWAWFDADTVLTLGSGFTWPETGAKTYDLGKLDDDTFAGQLLLGCQWNMTDTLSVDMGYRYFRIDHAELDAGEFDFHVEYEVEMITLGLLYRF